LKFPQPRKPPGGAGRRDPVENPASTAERFGADAEMADVLDARRIVLPRTHRPIREMRCGPFLPDIPPQRPPDLPKALSPRERLRVIRGSEGISAVLAAPVNPPCRSIY